MHTQAHSGLHQYMSLFEHMFSCGNFLTRTQMRREELVCLDTVAHLYHPTYLPYVFRSSYRYIFPLTHVFALTHLLTHTYSPPLCTQLFNQNQGLLMKLLSGTLGATLTLCCLHLYGCTECPLSTGPREQSVRRGAESASLGLS